MNLFYHKNINDIKESSFDSILYLIIFLTVVEHIEEENLYLYLV